MDVPFASDALVHRHGRRLELHAEPTAILWLGNTAAFALGDGSVRWIGDDGAAASVAVHGGAILAACRHPNGDAIITGGDDGRVCRVTPKGDVREIGRFERKWVEHLVASAASGLIVAGVGREAIVWTKNATEPSHRYTIGSTIGGLALDGKGKRLGVAHYNGATLFFASSAGSGRIALNWVGSHIGCTINREGSYLLTAVQETGLHGWKLPDLRDMRMGGYSAKTRSFSWSLRDKWLATSGDAQVILWPFEGKAGPVGKAPRMMGDRRDALVTRVAFHPRHDVLAIGYDDGVVSLGRFDDAKILPIDDEGAPITALAWNDAGTRLAWGDKYGQAGTIDMEARA